MNDTVYTITTWILPFLLCLVVHEFGHGWAAYALGDKTAKQRGRLTFNPKKHIDPIGTILVPGLLFLLPYQAFLFGWAKPVPIAFSHLRHPKRDMGLVAAAGPVANLLLAVVFVLIGRFIVFFLPVSSPITQWCWLNLQNGIALSLMLCIFNLIPILPLDGGRILASLLPGQYSLKYQRTEKYGFFILLGIVFVLPILGIDIAAWFIHTLWPFFARLVYLFV